MTNFTTESWTWYGFVVLAVSLRFTARLMHFKSVRRLQIEDWLMLFIFCLYTILIVFLGIDTNVQTNLINPLDIPHLTPQDIRQREWGSKMILLVEQCMCAVQWGTKTALLLLYWRITENLSQNKIVIGVAVYVASTYIVMEILYFGYWCRPFHEYWQTPTDNVECPTALHHLIMNLSFNLSSDLMLISIPLFLLLKAHMDLKRKILLVFPFSLGVLTMICAILSKHLSFIDPFSGYWVFWYCREASTAMIVTNMPYSWILIRRAFGLKSFFGHSRPDTDLHYDPMTLHGVSVRDPSIAESQKARNRSSRFFPGRLGRKASTSDPSPSGEMQMHAWHGQGDPNEKEPTKTVESTTNSSSAGSMSRVRVPVSTTAAALDRLYPVDDNELDLIEAKEKEREKRGLPSE